MEDTKIYWMRCQTKINNQKKLRNLKLSSRNQKHQNKIVNKKKKFLKKKLPIL